MARARRLLYSDLLTALVGDGDVAVAAWDRWRLAADLENLDPEAFRLLPSLYRRLEQWGVSHRWLPRLRGVYRYTWTANQLSARDLLDLVAVFRRAGVPLVANRGLPVVERYYGDPAGRLVDQVDLLVRPADIPAADQLLRDEGWHPRKALPPPPLRSVFATATYAQPGRRNVVLHWRSLLPFDSADEDLGVFERRQTAPFQGSQIPLLDPMDQVLLEAIHYRRHTPYERIIWAADLLHIFRHQGKLLSWSALWERASAIGVAGTLTRLMRRLRDSIGPVLTEVPLPPEAPAVGTDHPAAALLLGHSRGKPSLARAFHRARLRYLAWAAGMGRSPNPGGFVRFSLACYSYDWGVSLAGLPGEALRRLRDRPDGHGVDPWLPDPPDRDGVG